MPFNYTPKTEQQLRAERLLPKGDHRFKILESTEEYWQEICYLKFKLAIYSPATGGLTTRFDSIFPNNDWKLRHAACETGLEEEYENRLLRGSSFVSKEGTLIIDHRINKKTGEEEDYVKDYGVRKKKTDDNAVPKDYETYSALTAKEPASIDDDVPFFD